MNVLYLSHRIPYPPNKGDKIRSYNQVRHLAKKGKVYLGALIDEPRDVKYLKNLREICTEVCGVSFNPKVKKIKSPLWQISNQPASVYYFYNSRLQGWVDEVLRTNNIDLIFCFSSTMAEYLFRSSAFKAENKQRLLMDFCDVDSQKWLDYGKIKPWPISLFFKNEGRLLAKYEERVAEEFDVVFLVSSREIDFFNHGNKLRNIKVLENGVDLNFFTQKEDHKNCIEHPMSVVFTGAMDYDVNIDGVIWFVEKIWPQVKKQVSTAKFFIVGSNPVEKIKAFGKLEDIEVTGFVDDIREYYEIANVCVAPLRIARGIQNKVLEAMAMSKPVVATSNAFEGINTQPGIDLFVADDASKFARDVVMLLKNPEQAELLGIRARKCMELNYSWDAKMKVLEEYLPI